MKHKYPKMVQYFLALMKDEVIEIHGMNIILKTYSHHYGCFGIF